MAEQAGSRPRSVAAIVGLVLGVLAIVMSWMPIINNFAFVIGGVGIISAIVGLVGVLRGKKAGKELAIAAVVVNALSIVIVLGTQSMYSAAIDSATNGPDVVASEDGVADSKDENANATAEGKGASEDAPQTESLAVGTPVSFADGVTITVDNVTPGLVNYDGSPVIGIHVTYTNTGDEEYDYNSYSWKGSDAQGAATDAIYYSEATDGLSFGKLAPGGTVAGSIYFKGDSVSALYYPTVFAEAPAASWTIA